MAPEGSSRRIYERRTLAPYTDRVRGFDYVQVLDNPLNPALRLFRYLETDGIMKEITTKSIINNKTQKTYLQIKGPRESIRCFTEARWILDAHPDFVALTNAFYGKNPHSLGASQIMSSEEKDLVIAFALKRIQINKQTEKTRSRLLRQLADKEITVTEEDFVKLIDRIIDTVLQLPKKKMDPYLFQKYRTIICDLL